MPGTVANADKHVSSYSCSDAHACQMGESYFKKAAETCWPNSIVLIDIILYVVLVYFILFYLILLLSF